MKLAVDLIAAPTGMQPGGYVRRAYAERNQPPTPHLELEVARPRGTWSIHLRWPCPEPVTDIHADPALFPDAVALFAPQHAESNWITMGAKGLGVDGVLWRGNTDRLIAVRAEGLGSMTRSAAPSTWGFTARHGDGFWQLALTLANWSTLDRAGRMAAAVWRGSAQDRGGLKSVSPDWIDVG